MLTLKSIYVYIYKIKFLKLITDIKNHLEPPTLKFIYSIIYLPKYLVLILITLKVNFLFCQKIK